jgi:deazaflavin-dependent oxidoreductase (nitroreductase family)
MNLASERFLRKAFKRLNPFMLLLWRLGLGGWMNSWPMVGGRIMVITHTGRNSGQKRRTPVNYTFWGSDIFCVSGFGKGADWYRNLLKTPEVEVWLPDEWWAGRADDASEMPERLTVMRQVLIASGFASFAAGINPYTIRTEDLAKVTRDYRLMRIQLIQPCTGRDGPGDLAWAWLIAAAVLFVLWRRSSRRQGC